MGAFLQCDKLKAGVLGVDLQRIFDGEQAGYFRGWPGLRRGLKQAHLVWFIFPQIEGLGHSSMARKCAISSLAEAGAYLNDPVLGPRLEECCRLVNGIEERSANEIFGSPDDLKFRSSLTLFAHACPENRV